VTGKRPGRKVAVVIHRVPAGLDAAHVGFVFTDVMGNGHCGARACRAFAFQCEGPAPQAGAISGSACSWARSERNSILNVIVPADGTSAATVGNAATIYLTTEIKCQNQKNDRPTLRL
jgi:hypothetical protein